VSAFETLVHPGRGQVQEDHVVELINKAFRQKTLRKRDDKYVYVYPEIARNRFLKKKRRGSPKPGRENAAVTFYRRLYKLRNRMAHGDAFKHSDFVFPRSERRLDLPAPLLFRECLLERLRELGVLPGRPTGKPTVRQIVKVVEEHVLNAPYRDAITSLLVRERD
jgi:hypothetical protein